MTATRIGICDTSPAALLTDCAYDRVFAADANGDVRVEKDEQFGLVDRDGQRSRALRIRRASSAFPSAASYVYRVRGYACVEKGGALQLRAAGRAAFLPGVLQAMWTYSA